MAYQYTKISRKDIGRGIDARSAESAIAPGYAEDLQNIDTNSNGYLSKRPGYQGYYGWVPMRVESITSDGTDITLALNGAINTFNFDDSPIVVYGKLSDSGATGDFTTTDGAQYYTSFSSEIPDTFATGSSPYSMLEARHQVDTSDAFISVIESTDANNRDGTYMPVDRIDIENSDPYDIEFGYTLGANTTVFLLVTAKNGNGDGNSWAQTDTVSASSSATITITAATHQLSNFNVIPQFYYLDSTEWVQFLPDTVTVNRSTGQVDIDVTNSGGTDMDVRTVLSAAPAANVKSGSVGAASSGTVQATSISDDFFFTAAYATTSGAMFIPDSMTKDDDNSTLTATITNSGGTSETYEFFYEFTTLTSNALVVTPNATTSSYTDTDPQLTVWGLPHAGAYNSTSNQEGHTTHIDAYKRSGEERMVAGLGGNVFTARTRTEVGSDYLIPSQEVSLENRVSGNTILAPAFQTTGGSSSRTRGTVDADDVTSAGQAIVTAAALSVSGRVTYTLQLTNKSGDLSTALQVSSSDNVADWLTVTGMAHSLHNGTFKIYSVDNSSNTITVENSAATLDDFDEAGSSGYAAVYTDKLTLTNTANFALGDELTGEVLNALTATVKDNTSAAEEIMIDGVTSEVDLPAGLRVLGTRTSKVLPMAATTNFVRGDMCTVTGYDREMRVNRVRNTGNLTISADTIDGTEHEITLSGNHGLVAGDSFTLIKTGDALLDGTHTVTSITTSTKLKFNTTTATTTSTVNATMIGTALELDESFEWSDSTASTTTVSAVGRWIPAEAPTSSDNLVDSTYTYHFNSNTYTTQPILRSTIVTDNMYFTNNDDEVYKYDGTNLYRSGLVRWQPQLFAQIDTTTGSIPKSQISSAHAAQAENSIVMTNSTAAFDVGDRVWSSVTGSSAIYTIQSIDADNKIIHFVEDVSAVNSTGNLTKTRQFNYYFRLNAVDNNDNVIASAATGSEDFTVELTASGQIKIRLVGLPVWDVYDYDKLEVEVYRTKSNTEAPYYKVKVVDLDFNNYQGYLDITDALDDEFLQEFDFVTSALKGAELGTSWTSAPRAKYLTSANNQLILGNVKGYPELDITMRRAPGAASVSASDVDQKTFLFRKDDTDSGTSTDMVNRVKYEFVDGGTTTILPTATASTVDAAVAGDVTDNSGIQFNDTAHGFITGTKVQVSSAGTLPTGLSASTDYYIIKVDDDNYKFATNITNAVAGTAISWTDDGSGIHTVTPQHNITRTSSTFVVESPSHGLTAGDWIYMYHSAVGTDNDLQFAGWWQIGSVTTHSFTVNFTNSATVSTEDVDTFVTATTTTDIPVWMGTDGNRNLRGANTINEATAMQRLADAINASMRVVDLAVSGMSTFIPWMTAAAGAEVGVGRLVVRQDKVFSDTMEVVLPASISTAQIFVQSLLRTASATVGASTPLFPSRVVASYSNYPELFDDPYGQAGAGDSAIDVNSSDGQEITGIIPFFGESVFGQGQVESLIVVFKTNSVYLVDIASKQISKIQSRGLGCSAPFSIASTRDGIMFANESGIYRLNRDQSISYVGKHVERLWEDSVDKTYLAKATGHHYGVGRKYKLSVPYGDSQATNNQVFVYDHQREGRDQEFGAWTRYTNHNSTGWANLASDAFFSTTDGQVYKIRNAGDSTDYRDDASAVAEAVILLRADDFGVSGARKIISNIVSHFQMRRSSMTGTSVLTSPDLDGTFASADSFNITRDGVAKVETVSLTPPRRRLIYLQTKYTNSTKDEDLTLAGVDYNVALLREAGIPEGPDKT